jgi:hypothetical protein
MPQHFRKNNASLSGPEDESSSSPLTSPSIDRNYYAEAYELREIPPLEDVGREKNDRLDVHDAEHDDLLPSPRRFSIGSVQSFELYTPDEDTAVLRKLDRRLVAFMALLYCLSFLDRSSECF